MIILDILQAFNTLHMQNTHLVVRIIYKKILKKKIRISFQIFPYDQIKDFASIFHGLHAKKWLELNRNSIFPSFFISKEKFIARRLLRVLFFLSDYFRYI